MHRSGEARRRCADNWWLGLGWCDRLLANYEWGIVMQVTKTDLERVAAKVIERFPLADYFDPFLSGHLSIAQTVSRYLAPGSRLLDFGAGPADKTAVLAALGYKCTAIDDLGDEWHKRGEARQMILDFADEMGIDYITLETNDIPRDR